MRENTNNRLNHFTFNTFTNAVKLNLLPRSSLACKGKCQVIHCEYCLNIFYVNIRDCNFHKKRVPLNVLETILTV